jgi:hypothetical protein
MRIGKKMPSEIFAWAGLIAFSADIFASLAVEALYGGLKP